ncbi:MAG: hypothetical protein QNJ05_00300 [Woeseiaceae bacterium]|nr:hypothetical protein [Woeseiaceae bacterium]
MNDTTPKPVMIEGKPLHCLICEHDRFYRRRIQLNTRGLTFLKLDWLNRTGQGVVCERCGYVHTFLPPDR